MKRKIAAILTALTLALPLAACGEGEETTLTGMVVSVDGTVIQLVEMDESNLRNMGGADRAEGERPQMPEGMEGFELPEGMEGFDPSNMQRPGGDRQQSTEEASDVFTFVNGGNSFVI